LALAAVVATYLAISVAESLLAPLFPSIAEAMGLSVSSAGLALGVLTASIAVGNLVGGWSLRRLPLRAVAVTSLAIAGSGCALASTSGSFPLLLLSQAIIGLGVGLFFAPGLKATGLAGANRRGLAMGLFGVAFSAGLAVAAFLASRVESADWRDAFVVATWASAFGVVVLLVIRLPNSAEVAGGRGGLGALRLPVMVGTVGTISQYGTVGFLTLFAVTSWGFAPAQAATMLAISRVLSAPGKIVVGSVADRVGSRATLRAVVLILLVSGIGWSLAPPSALSTVAAVVFAATVSALFPIANLVAFERFGNQGSMLGTYRSAQIAVGSVAAFLIGILAESQGLRTVLTACVLIPAVLLVPLRESFPVT
jgi:predicted MFS family arabinose efflux permease